MPLVVTAADGVLDNTVPSPVNVTLVTVPDPLLGVCHVAAVLLVAVSTCPLDGAVAPLTATVVVALFKPLAAVAVPDVNPDAVPVMLVPTNADGVPRAGVTKVGDVARTTEPDPVVASSPRTPPLLYSTFPVEPPVIVVEPIIRPPDTLGVAHVPSPRR